jgi:hypothetical protein
MASQSAVGRESEAEGEIPALLTRAVIGPYFSTKRGIKPLTSVGFAKLQASKWALVGSSATTALAALAFSL